MNINPPPRSSISSGSDSWLSLTLTVNSASFPGREYEYSLLSPLDSLVCGASGKRNAQALWHSIL